MADLAELMKEADRLMNKSAEGPSGAGQEGEGSVASGRGAFLAESAKRGMAAVGAIPTMAVDAATTAANIGMPQVLRALNPALGAASEYLRSTLPSWLQTPPNLTEMQRRGWQGITQSDPTMQPPDALARYLGKGTEFLVAGGPFSARNIAQATHAIPAIAGELGSSFAGGIGSELGGELSEKAGMGRATGELLGGFAGGITGGASATLASKGMGLAQQVKPSYVGDVAQDAGRMSVGNALATAPGGPAAAQREIERSLDVASQIEAAGGRSMRPTLGQASGVRAVTDIERNLAGRTPQAHGEALAREAENQAAVAAARDRLFPSGGEFGRAASDQMARTERELKTRLTRIEEQRARLSQDLPEASQQEIGKRLRSAADEAYNTARTTRDNKYRSVYEAAEKNNIREDMTDVSSLVKTIKADDPNVFQDMPGTFGKVLRRYAEDEAPAGPVSFKELHSLMKEANASYYALERSNDPRKFEKMYYLNQLRESLRGKVNKYEGEEFGDVATLLKDANTFYTDTFRRAFREGVGAEMREVGRFGDQMAKEDIVRRFFTPTGMDDFYAVYGGNEQARQAMGDGVLDLARRAVIRNGKVNQTAMEGFLRKHEEALSKLPEVREALRNVDSANDAFVSRAARAKQAASEIDRTTLAKLAKTDDPAAVISGAIGDRKQLMALMAAAKTTDQKQGIVRAIVDEVPNAAKKAGVTPLDYVMANEQTLRSVMGRAGGPQHFENLKLLANAHTILGRGDIPKYGNVPALRDKIEEVTGTTGQSALSQFRAAFITRQQGQHYVIASVLAKYGLKLRGEHMERTQREIVNNPELASELVKAMSQRTPLKDTGNRMTNLLEAAGIRAVSTADDKE